MSQAALILERQPAMADKMVLALRERAEQVGPPSPCQGRGRE